MTEAELFNISPRSLFNKLIGFRKIERDNWERTRIQTYLMLSPYFDKKSSVSPQELMPFPWDEELVEKVKVSAEEAREARQRIWAEIDAGKN